jgi:oligosaccharide translocation protein RFT1
MWPVYLLPYRCRWNESRSCPPLLVPHFLPLSLIPLSVGALFESFGEPWINLYNNRSQLAPRARADAIAVTVRSLTTLLCVIHLKMGVTGFGIAQTAYGVSHFLSLLLSSDSVGLFLPAVPPSSPSSSSVLSPETLFHLPMVNTALQMTGTSLLKHVLTEGDRIVLSLSEDHYNQGIYAVTLNYGSLVARLLFQPLEESCRISFAQIAGNIHSLRSQSEGEQTAPAVQRVDVLMSTLRSSVLGLLRVVLLCGSLIPIFGPLYARLLVKIVLGPRWYSEETVLSISAFCGYLFLMGCNGISEAFVQSAAPAHLFGAMNQSLFLSSFVFYASSPLLIASHGTVGIILANSLSMGLRVLLNLRFISSYFASCAPSSSTLLEILPSSRETAFSAIAFAVLHHSSSRYATSAMTLTDAASHVAIGVAIFIALAGHHGLSHWRDVRDLLRGRPPPSPTFSAGQELDEQQSARKKKDE